MNSVTDQMESKVREITDPNFEVLVPKFEARQHLTKLCFKILV